ncbi:MAG: LacI family transcriptional regulator [Balneolales bacterium]|nr:LacI family transcriptional regulator [Balneolales bacterium]
MGKKVTLKDIAEDSGLSISTVSRALARTGKISRENEKKIFESAQRLNYPLAIVDTPIELRKNVNIALVTHFYTGEFFSSLFHGFDEATAGGSSNIRLLSVANSSDTAIEIVAGLKRNNFDAAVVFLPEFTEKDYRDLLKAVPANFPLVSAAPIVNPVLDTVTFDHYRGGFLVAEHLMERGYQKLGIIIGPQSKSEALLRKNGFLDYVAASDQLKVVWDFKGDYSVESGMQAYKAYKQYTDKPDAIFCSNDDVAMGFTHAAVRDGVEIPGNVAIAGFDDLPKCEYFTPSLTSVYTPYTLLGKKVIELIHERLRDSKKSHIGYTSLIPVTLSVRESTAPFASSRSRIKLSNKQ